MAYKWCSQPRLRTKGVPAGDFALSVNCILSGNNYNKVALLMKFMNVGIPNKDFHHAVERLYTCPAVDTYWADVKSRIWRECKDRQLVLSGMFINSLS